MGLLKCFQLCIFVCNFISSGQGSPDVFQDYFDGEVKVVDISQKTALEACLASPAAILGKVNTATSKCFGGDSTFDWDDFADLNKGSDTDENGLTVKMENAEACFYKSLGWLQDDGSGVNDDVITQDFDNLKTANIKDTFIDDISDCKSWNGNFGPARMKRSAEDEEIEEFGVLGLARSLSRQRRQASGRAVVGKGGRVVAGGKAAGKAGGKVGGKAGGKVGGKVGGNAGGFGAGGRAGGVNGPKGSGPRYGAGKGKGKGKGTVKGKGTGKGKGKGKGNAVPGKVGSESSKSGSSGAELTISPRLYNQLWCAELAVQKALRNCVIQILRTS